MSQSNQLNLSVDTFSDNQLENKIDSYKANGNIYEIEFDIMDGNDWWQEFYELAEEKFGNEWKKIRIKTQDSSKGRLLDRNYCRHGVIDHNDFSYIDKLFLMGNSSFKNFDKIFSNHITLRYESRKIDKNIFYEKGTDEEIIKLLMKFRQDRGQSINVVDVVYNTSEQAITAIKLVSHYDAIIHIPTKQKLNRLIALSKGKEFIINSYEQMLHAKRIAKLYSADFLEDIYPLIKNFDKSIFDESENYCDVQFRREFCK